jgi:ATP-dependent DNA ligase
LRADRRPALALRGCRLDLEGIVAKRKRDPYGERTAWYKIENPTYTQAEGRRELFERPRR